MTYPELAARWRNPGGAGRANYGRFLQHLGNLLGVPRYHTKAPTRRLTDRGFGINQNGWRLATR